MRVLAEKGCALLLALMPILLLQGQSIAQEPPTAQLQFIEGEDLSCQVLSIQQDKVLCQTSDSEQSEFDLAELIRIVFPGGSKPFATPQSYILLRNGAQLSGQVIGCQDSRCRFHCSFASKAADFPLSSIQAIRFSSTTLDDEGGFQKYLHQPKDDRDLIYILDAKKKKVHQRTVVIQSLTQDLVTYERRGKVKSLPIQKLYGLIMGKHAALAPDRQPRPRVVLTLHAGAALEGKLSSMSAKTCTLRMDEGVELAIQRQALKSIQVLSDRLVYLVDLQPKSVQQVPAFSRTRPWLKNASPSGADVFLAGKQRQQSLVLLPRTRLTYDLGDGFDVFATSIGIESRSTGPAHALFRVYVDGNKVFESSAMTRATPPVDLSIPVTGGKQMSVEVDFGRHLDFGDHCVFAEARLTRKAN